MFMANYNEKPSILEAVGNGSFLYRFNIVEKTSEIYADGVDEPASTRTSFDCDEVTVWPPITSNRITEAVIGHLFPPSWEQKLVNEFNAASLGLFGGSKTSDEAKAKTEAYKDFLRRRDEVKRSIDADCAALGIAEK